MPRRGNMQRTVFCVYPMGDPQFESWLFEKFSRKRGLSLQQMPGLPTVIIDNRFKQGLERSSFHRFISVVTFSRFNVVLSNRPRQAHQPSFVRFNRPDTYGLKAPACPGGAISNATFNVCASIFL